ncbi:MAG: c-type cytochrome [Alphaproteobacteria bacterium]
MTGPESNKIFAAFLIAGITAYLAAFVGDKLVYPKKLETNAVEIEGAELEAAGATAVLMPEPIMHLIANADIAQGERLSRACAACHTFNSGGATMIGPNLWDTFGNRKAHIDGFAYSNTLAEMQGNWGYNELNWFLWRPRVYVEGTKMNYIGLRRPEDRAAMIAWLRTLSNSPKPLPTQAQIDAEKAELSPPEPEETAEATESSTTDGESDTAQN